MIPFWGTILFHAGYRYCYPLLSSERSGSGPGLLGPARGRVVKRRRARMAAGHHSPLRGSGRALLGAPAPGWRRVMARLSGVRVFHRSCP